MTRELDNIYYIIMNEEEVKRMKVSELKEALSTRGLSTTGRKDELASRLLSSLPASTGVAATPVAPSSTKLPAAPKAHLPPSAPGSTQSMQELLKLDPLSLERMRARQARFGTVTSEQLKKTEEEEARKKRAERFS